MDLFQIDRALKNIFEYLSTVNAYVDNQAPWSLKKTNKEPHSWPVFVSKKCLIY